MQIRSHENGYAECKLQYDGVVMKERTMRYGEGRGDLRPSSNIGVVGKRSYF